MSLFKTLADALDLGAEGVILYCAKCLNRKVIPPVQARRHWPEDFTFKHIAERSRCKCGAVATKASPAWPIRSRGGSAPLPIVPKAWGRLPD